MLHLQEQLGFRRKEARFTPIKNYERMWERIVTALKQDDYGMVSAEPERQIRYKKERVQQMMRLYTPIDYKDIVQGETLHSHQSAKLRLTSAQPSKSLLRRQTDCFTELQIDEVSTPAETVSLRPTSAVTSMRRPLSSFQKSKQQQHPSQQLRPVPQSQMPIKSQSQRANNPRPFVPPVGLTAYAYLVMELPQTYHITWNSQTQLEVASLTKIMTCLVVLRLLQESEGDIEQTVEVGSFETSINGTTAEL